MRYLIFILMLLCGCAVNEKMDLAPYVKQESTIGSSNILIIRTTTLLGIDDKSYSYEDLQTLRESDAVIKDRYIDNDVESLKQLANKYECGVIFIHRLEELQIYERSTTEQTKTMLVVLGEGEPFRFCPLIVKFRNGNMIAGTKIYYKDILKIVNRYKGEKCVLIGACQAGSALEVIPDDFKGVVITSAPKGYATTPCESTDHTSLMTEILKHTDENLASCDLGYAGTTINGMRHKWVDFWSGNNLPISYIIERFANTEFKLGR